MHLVVEDRRREIRERLLVVARRALAGAHVQLEPPPVEDVAAVTATTTPIPAPHGMRPVLAANQVPIFVYGCIRGTGQYNKERALPVSVFGKSTRELSGHTEENLGFV